jgi:chromosome segregation ATPase
MLEHARDASERLQEADRMKTSAMQEAAYYRAKAAALENGSEEQLSQVERERATQLEKKLSQLAIERSALDRKFTELNESLSLQTTLLEQAEARASDASRRAEQLEETHKQISREHFSLQEAHTNLQSSLRDHSEQLLAAKSKLEQREADDVHVQSQLEQLSRSRDQHVRVLESTRAALEAASSRAQDIDNQHQRDREVISQLEADVVDLRGELEARSLEVDNLRSRLADVENSWAKSREEADSFRAATTGSLGQLLDSHRDLRADEDRATRGHAEKIQAMENEAASLRKILGETSQRLEDVRVEAARERRNFQELSLERSVLQSQTVGLRSQLASALSDASRLRTELSAQKAELAEKSKELSEAQVRLTTMRNYLAENGIGPDDEDLPSNADSLRVAELEAQLAERSRQHEEVERELEQLAQDHREAKQELIRARTARSSPSANHSASEARARELEKQLEELAAKNDETEKELNQLKDDYQLAVHYVK